MGRTSLTDDSSKEITDDSSNDEDSSACSNKISKNKYLPSEMEKINEESIESE